MFDRAGIFPPPRIVIGESQHMTEPGLGEPEPDVVEQHQEAVPSDEESPDAEIPARVPLEADPADAAEQSRTVELGEDEYR
jgi:hypothetical protein